MDNSYRNVLITGASSGLGRALSLWFARRGARVYAAARREEQLQSLRAEASVGPGEVVPVRLDVADTEAVVANAGVGGRLNGARTEWADISRMLQVNILGATATLTALAPRMAERKKGHLVGVASLAAWIVVPRFGIYGASKRYLQTLCEGLRLDMPPGVRVTSINPGFVKSEMTAENRFPMPFLLETEDAADRMGRAILRGDALFAFPWQTAWLTRLGSLLPSWLVSRTMGFTPPKSG
jgi:short-subunit dehydrogenase